DHAEGGSIDRQPPLLGGPLWAMLASPARTAWSPQSHSDLGVARDGNPRCFARRPGTKVPLDHRRALGSSTLGSVAGAGAAQSSIAPLLPAPGPCAPHRSLPERCDTIWYSAFHWFADATY